MKNTILVPGSGESWQPCAHELLFNFAGNQFMSSFGLWPLTQGYSGDYLDNFDPRITNEFSTAAFRQILFILKFYFIDWVRVAGFHIRLKLIGQWVCIPFSLRNETKRLLPNRRVVFQENLASESPLIRCPNRGKTRKLLNWYKQSRLTIIRRGRGNGKDLYSSDYSSNPVFKSTIFCCQIVVKKKRRLAHLKHNYL